MFCFCNGQNKIVCDTLAYNIIFGDYFSDDKVDLFIDNTLVFKSMMLNSKDSDGLTSVWAKVTLKYNQYFVSFNGGEKRIIQLNHKKQLFKTILNGNIKEFTIIKNKGRHLLFYNNKDKGIQLLQTRKSPALD